MFPFYSKLSSYTMLLSTKNCHHGWWLREYLNLSYIYTANISLVDAILHKQWWKLVNSTFTENGQANFNNDLTISPAGVPKKDKLAKTNDLSPLLLLEARDLSILSFLLFISFFRAYWKGKLEDGLEKNLSMEIFHSWLRVLMSYWGLKC